jgi:hypothetical protein
MFPSLIGQYLSNIIKAKENESKTIADSDNIPVGFSGK